MSKLSISTAENKKPCTTDHKILFNCIVSDLFINTKKIFYDVVIFTRKLDYTCLKIIAVLLLSNQSIVLRKTKVSLVGESPLSLVSIASRG